jgi:Zn-dependent protease with chaperone function
VKRKFHLVALIVLSAVLLRGGANLYASIANGKMSGALFWLSMITGVVGMLLDLWSSSRQGEEALASYSATLPQLYRDIKSGNRGTRSHRVQRFLSGMTFVLLIAAGLTAWLG